MSDDEAELKPLSPHHQDFVDEYLRDFNGTRAYSAAYPRASSYTARVNASKLLTNTNIKAHIAARIAEHAMGADEALQRLADIARGDIGDFMGISSVGYDFDLKAAREAGLTKLIRKIKQKTTTRIGKKNDDDDIEVTELEIELYSAKDAIDTLLKVGGKLKDSEVNIKVTLTDD